MMHHQATYILLSLKINNKNIIYLGNLIDIPSAVCTGEFVKLAPSISQTGDFFGLGTMKSGIKGVLISSQPF